MMRTFVEMLNVHLNQTILERQWKYRSAFKLLLLYIQIIVTEIFGRTSSTAYRQVTYTNSVLIKNNNTTLFQAFC